MKRHIVHSIVHKIHSQVLAGCWVFILPPAVLLTSVLTFEETYLTWVQGPRTIGYVFSHAFPTVVLICILSVYLCYAWVGTLLATSLLTASPPSRSDSRRALLIVATLALEWVTTDQWQRLIGWVLGQ